MIDACDQFGRSGPCCSFRDSVKISPFVPACYTLCGVHCAFAISARLHHLNLPAAQSTLECLSPPSTPASPSIPSIFFRQQQPADLMGWNACTSSLSSRRYPYLFPTRHPCNPTPSQFEIPAPNPPPLFPRQDLRDLFFTQLRQYSVLQLESLAL